MKRIVSLLLAVLLALPLAACQSAKTPEPSASIPADSAAPSYNPLQQRPEEPGEEAPIADKGEPKYGGVVKFIESLDTSEPFGLTWEPLFARGFNVPWSENLLNFTQAGEFEPWLAKNWVVDTEAHTITFELNEGVYFSDGSEFTAEVVAWNIDRWTEDGKNNEDITYAEAIDKYTVVVHYDNWQNVLLQTFASHSYSMISMENYVKNGREYARQHPVGTGPFVLSEWKPGESIKFVRNENYWQEGKPYLDGVEYYEITDVMTQNAAMESTGEDGIDLYQSMDAEQCWTLISRGVPFDYSNIRASGTFTIAPNSVDPDSPFYDLRVRQALAYAVDREAICEATGFGFTKPAYQLTAEGFSGHLPDDNPYLVSCDPEKAKALLAEAGYPDGFETTLYADSRAKNDVVILQSQLEQVGIRCKLQFPESGAMTDLYNNGWDGLMVLNFGQITNTGISYFIWYHPDITSYVSAMRPPEYKEMYLEARRSFNIDNKLFGALGELVLKYMTLVPVYHGSTIFFIRNGLEDSGFGYYSTDTIWLPSDAWWSAGG